MLLATADGEIDVWQIALTQPTAILPHLHTLLSSAERARAARFVFPQDRDRYVVAHAALRSILASTLELSPAALDFHHGPNGKPYLEGRPLHFNLAHAGEFSLVAVCRNRRLGIDLEPLRDLPDALALAEQFHPAERVSLSAGHRPSARAFFECWTRKEAFVKATGEGLARPLASFDITADLPGWHVLDLPGPAGYCAALVAEAFPNESGATRPAVQRRTWHAPQRLSP